MTNLFEYRVFYGARANSRSNSSKMFAVDDLLSKDYVVQIENQGVGVYGPEIGALEQKEIEELQGVSKVRKMRSVEKLPLLTLGPFFTTGGRMHSSCEFVSSLSLK